MTVLMLCSQSAAVTRILPPGCSETAEKSVGRDGRNARTAEISVSKPGDILITQTTAFITRVSIKQVDG